MSYFEVKKLPPISTPMVTGSIVTFNSQYALPLKSHTVDIDSVSGVSAINIQRIASDEVISTIPSAGIDSTGKIIADVRFFLIIAPITSGINYVMDNSDTQFVYAFYSDIPVGGSQSYDTSRVVNTNNQFNAPINGYVAIRANAGVSDYSICKGNAYTINIGQTVNEGEYDARTGILEATLPTVQTIQLPPCPIDTLEGVNNIWADTGDTTLQYPKFG